MQTCFEPGCCAADDNGRCASALLGGDDTDARKLLFEFFARAARTLVLALFEIAERKSDGEILFTIQTSEFVNGHATSN